MDNKIKDIVENIIKREIYSIEDNLYNLGLDSLSAVMLVCYLEAEFKIHIQDCDLDIENFETLGSIEEMVRKYV